MEADSIDKAIEIVNKMYKNEEIVLAADDFVDVEIQEFRDKSDDMNEKDRLIQDVIDYLLADEKQHYEELTYDDEEIQDDSKKEEYNDHIYLKLVRLKALI